MDTTNMLAPTLASQVESLRRSLKQVMHEAQTALDQMDAGSRPGLSISGPLLSSATDVEREAGKVELLLNWAGSPVLDNDAAIAALTGQ